MLITGVSGMLGSNLAYYFRDTYEVLGLYRTHAVVIDGVRTQEADILSGGPFKKTVEDFSPDVVIHCASVTDVDFCETHKELTRKVNVLGTRMVVDSISGANANLIYISSDSVYDGDKGNFLETDPIRPMNYYGLSKYEGELETLKHGNSLVLRTNIFGWNTQDKFSIAEWIVHDLSAGTQVNGFRDAYSSSIYTLELAEIMAQAMARGLTGVYNCGSSTSMSKYSFAVCLAERMALDTSLIRPISIDDYGFVAKRGKDLSLDVGGISAALERDLPTIEESIDSFCRDLRAGLGQVIKGAA
jgi:dTDP-4-dehydrorhamnose reductase